MFARKRDPKLEKCTIVNGSLLMTNFKKQSLLVAGIEVHRDWLGLLIRDHAMRVGNLTLLRTTQQQRTQRARVITKWFAPSHGQHGTSCHGTRRETSKLVPHSK